MNRYIYLAEKEDRSLMKIGASYDPERRAKQLKCGLLFTIRGGAGAEKRVLRKFSHYRRGGEWFKHSQTIASFFAEHSDRVLEIKRKKRSKEDGLLVVMTRLPRPLLKELKRKAKSSGMFMETVYRQAAELWLKENNA